VSLTVPNPQERAAPAGQRRPRPLELEPTLPRRQPRAIDDEPSEPELELGADPETGAADLLEAVEAGAVQWGPVYEQMLQLDCCLFARDILSLEIGPHLLAWGDMIYDNDRIATLAARDHSKSTFWSYAYPIWRAWMDPGCEVYIFSKTLDSACEFLDIIVYGKDNLSGLTGTPALAHMVPSPDEVRRDPRLRLNRADVRLKNGSRIRAMGWGKATRGRHPKYIVCDDVLNDEDMWSETVRMKNIEYFRSAISQMVAPDGQLVVVGTPFHMADLYGELRQNKRYKFVAFPGIVSDPKTGIERALFHWRWTLESLYAKRTEIGNVAFAREILCQPISDDLSVFPSYLFPPLFDKALRLRPTLAELRGRGWTTYMGVDIARSANVGADYFVIFVIGKDRQGFSHVVDIRRSKGLPFRKQLEEIAVTAQLYDPALIFIESNAMQQVYTDEMRRLTDLPVKEFVTLATNKYPLDRGVPGLRILMENGKLVIPRNDELSRRITDVWIRECQMFGYIDGKLQGIGTHDDTVMSWWFAMEAAKAGGFSFAFGAEDTEASDDFMGDGGDESWEAVMLGDSRADEAEGGFGI